MNLNSRNRVAAWLMLLVFVPMVLCSGVHTHKLARRAILECIDCQSHAVHDAHVQADVSSDDDCPLCRFVSTQYVKPTAVACAIVAQHVTRIVPPPVSRIVVAAATGTQWRAPPMLIS